MLRVGERTGQMGEMMERIAAFHEEELARWVERFTRTFEPLLMAVIGVVIGGIVVLMYFPIFELAGSMRLNPRELESASAHPARGDRAGAQPVRRRAASVPSRCSRSSAGCRPKAFVAGAGGDAGLSESLPMSELDGLTPAFDLLPYTEALARGCLLFRNGRATSWCWPSAIRSIASLRPWAEERIRAAVQWRLAHAADVSAYPGAPWRDHARDGFRAHRACARKAHRGRLEELSLKTISEDASPVVKLVHSTLYDALKAGASDIHLETTASQLVIKYRLDGVLSMVGTAAGLDMAEQVISRIKVMAELDIAERRMPQDGRFKVLAQGREIDFRVSVMPSIFGEDAVLRILDKQSLADHVKGLQPRRAGIRRSRPQRRCGACRASPTACCW